MSCRDSRGMSSRRLIFATCLSRNAKGFYGTASLKEQRHVIACVAGWGRFAFGTCDDHWLVVGYRPPTGDGYHLAFLVACLASTQPCRSGAVVGWRAHAAKQHSNLAGL